MTPLRITAFQLGPGPVNDGALAAFRALDRPPPGGPARTPLPGATLLVARAGDRPVARASWRLARGLVGAPPETGVIGHYEGADGEAGAAVLSRAVAALGDAGAVWIVGPMDGTTWDRYRLALPGSGPGGSDPPPFLGEPVNPPDYPAHFEAAGFRPAEQYLSRLIPELDALEERTREVERRMADAGFGFARFHADRFDRHLDELLELSLAAFADNPYYSPIDRDGFRALYTPALGFLDPELVILVRDRDDALAGFAFSYPDPLDPAARDDGRPRRVILKSLAVAPSSRGAGLGSLLVHETHRRARARGHAAVIHALMHEANPSHRISRHGGDVYRRYALYGRSP